VAASSTTPLLSVKQTMPPVRVGVVPRARLERRLETADTKLTTVVAPAGWGKTSLLTRWAHTVSDDTPVAWVSLDETDDEPTTFWSYVVTSLTRVSDQISNDALDVLRATTDGLLTQALPMLLNELAEVTTTHVLVLDDLHVITNRDVHESLEYLLAYLPPTLRIVIASRWDPPLPLARMRVRGELTEVRADDLRFSREESAALISAVCATDLDPATTTAVWEQTEGWAAGLQLAGLTLRDAPAKAAVQIVGDDRHLFDYFTAEVFPALAPAQRDLLVRAAPLELLSGSLCDAALDAHGSARVLAELERADLFVVALDASREWYRCHPLLRDALMRTPEGHSARSEGAVLRRAARWFEENDRIDDAVRHFLNAGDTETAASLLQNYETWFRQRGLASTYLTLGERLPEHAIHASLALSMTYAAEFTWQRDRGVRWLDICDRRIDDDTVVDRWQSPRAAVLVMRAVMGVPMAESAMSVAMLEQALALEMAAGAADNPVAQIALGRAYGLDGRFDQAVHVLSAVKRRRVQIDWWVDVDPYLAGLLGLFLLQLDRGDEVDRLLAEARRFFDVAARGTDDVPPLVTMLLSIVEGRRSHQRRDLARGRDHLTEGLRVADIVARPVFTVLGLVYLVDLEIAAGNRPAAEAALVQAKEIVANDPVPRFAQSLLDDAETRLGRVAVRAAIGAGALVESLTDRELSILRMLPGSATQREIGAALYLSINTVKAYNKSLYRKLGVGGRQDAVRVARRLELI
jgi:LuxR family transcriptional regulator, maltose regulon positive regulatory protein